MVFTLLDVSYAHISKTEVMAFSPPPLTPRLSDEDKLRNEIVKWKMETEYHCCAHQESRLLESFFPLTLIAGRNMKTLVPLFKSKSKDNHPLCSRISGQSNGCALFREATGSAGRRFGNLYAFLSTSVTVLLSPPLTLTLRPMSPALTPHGVSA